MTIILDFLQQAFIFAISVTILLGVLIFFHELGHFLVAKHYNVKVLTFSLGFGPKLWQYTRGETTYCISAIPFGGYVKMYGDEFGGSVPDDMKNRSFLDKPIYQRINIALAGPLMNLALAFVIFVIIAFSGEQVVAPQLGEIEINSTASKLGFRSGDRFISINGQPIGRWEDAEQIITQSQGVELTFVVQHDYPSDPETIKATPTTTDGKNIFQMGEKIGQIEGFDFMDNSSLIAVSNPNSIFGKLGFQTGDQIMMINKSEVKTLRSLPHLISSQGDSKQLTFKVNRHDLNNLELPPKQIEIVWNLTQTPPPNSYEELGIQKPETFVGQVSKDSPADKAGMKANDHIETINGAKINTFKDIIAAVSSFKENDAPLKVNVSREGKPMSFAVSPKMTELKNEGAPTEKRFTIGIVPLKSPYVEYTKWTAPTFIGAFTWAGKKTWQWTHATVMSFVLLAQNKVSAKNLGGFISIGQMAKKSWDMGFDAFLRIMAIISLNLFILNLLPVPVLDGGHILLFTIEAIKGAPLSLKKMAIAQQIGVFLLLSLLAFSLFNDFSRLLGFS